MFSFSVLVYTEYLTNLEHGLKLQLGQMNSLQLNLPKQKRLKKSSLPKTIPVHEREEITTFSFRV